MKNFEKYKTAEERADAFNSYCKKGIIRCAEGYSCVLCKFAWLELEAAEEKPLPCPFCGNPTYVDTIVGFKNVSCSYCGMKSPTHKHTNEAEAIAEFNRVALAVMAAKKKEEK